MTVLGLDSEPQDFVTLRHRTLHTTFRGLRHKASTPEVEVQQYRGIKYANIPVRFRRSVLHEEYAPVTDATRHGAISPQIKNKWLESRLYGLPSDIVPKPTYVPPMNEHECLNLNITIPAPESLPADLQDAPKLPVMVWIHGGGNVTGAASEWICDPGQLVRRSVELGLPVIAVSVNFRLGLLGFGASELLRQDNASVGEEGVGNYGLHDQRTALTWIRKHIAGFGGDPTNVTLFGSSWGAADIHAHLLSTANYNDVTTPPSETHHGPLFHRAILQSGALVPSSSVVQDVYSAGKHLARIMSALHIRTIEELRKIPAAKLVALTGERVRPVDDGVFLRKDWKTLTLPVASVSEWRQDVIIGDVACESVLWAIPARLWGADAVARRARAIVQSVRRADVLMRAYDIVDQRGHSVEEALVEGQNNPDIDIEAELEEAEEAECELAERVMELINDVAFAWPVDVAARCAADSAYVLEDATREDRKLTEENEQENENESDGEVHATGAMSLSVTVSSTDSDPATPFPTKQSNGRLPNAPYVYRYVFDQASPYTDTPHHGVDLLYLFGNIPFPSDPEFTEEENNEVNWDRVKIRDEMQRQWLAFANGKQPWDPLTPQVPTLSETLAEERVSSTRASSRSSSFSSHTGPGGLSPFTAFTPMHGRGHLPPVFSPPASRSNSFSQHDVRSAFLNSHSHNHNHPNGSHSPHPFVSPFQTRRDSATHQNRAFDREREPPSAPVHADMPVSISDSDKVFVFGPEGETGARSKRIFEGRRRVHAWREALAPLGLATAQKVGLELGNGPPVSGVARF